MATTTRQFFRDEYYHVFDRGNHKDVIFRDNADRKYFLSKLDEFCERDRITVIAYCLLDNHFHIALRQDSNVPVTSVMQSLLGGYARMYNAKYGTVGSLFQGRFRAKLVGDGDYLVRLSRYIHLNPHPFVDYRKYRWSSYGQYTSDKLGVCDPGPVLDYFDGSKTSYTIYTEKSVSSGDEPDHRIVRRVVGRNIQTLGHQP